MSREHLETWLLERANASIGICRSAFEIKQREIDQLATILTTGNDNFDAGELERLQAIEAELAREIADTEARLRQASEEFAARADRQLAQLAEAEDARLLSAAQQIFDKHAPNHLTQPLHQLSFPLLRSELAQSSLVTDLQRWLSDRFEACSAELQSFNEEAQELHQMQSSAGSKQLLLEQVRESLQEHRVDPAILTRIRELNDQAWFLEEIVQPYCRAATVEARWKLSRSILEELL